MTFFHWPSFAHIRLGGKKDRFGNELPYEENKKALALSREATQCDEEKEKKSNGKNA